MGDEGYKALAPPILSNTKLHMWTHEAGGVYNRFLWELLSLQRLSKLSLRGGWCFCWNFWITSYGFCLYRIVWTSGWVCQHEEGHEDSHQEQQCDGHDCQGAIQCIPDCPGKLQKARATQCGIPLLVRVVPLGLGEAQQGQGAYSEHHLSCDNDNGSLRYIKDEKKKRIYSVRGIHCKTSQNHDEWFFRASTFFTMASQR